MEELGRFPAHELDDQGSRSIARHIVATGALLGGLKLFLEAMASDLGDRQATPEEHKLIREYVADQLSLLTKMITNQELTRPWPNETGPFSPSP